MRTAVQVEKTAAARPGAAARYRLGVAVRAVAAIGGGYLLTAIGATLLALLLPMDRADAVIVATLLSFAVYACVVLWVFAAASAWRAGIGVLGACALLALPAWMMGGTL